MFIIFNILKLKTIDIENFIIIFVKFIFKNTYITFDTMRTKEDIMMELRCIKCNIKNIKNEITTEAEMDNGKITDEKYSALVNSCNILNVKRLRLMDELKKFE